MLQGWTALTHLRCPATQMQAKATSFMCSLSWGGVRAMWDAQPCRGITDAHIAVAELCRLQAGVAAHPFGDLCHALATVQAWLGQHTWASSGAEPARALRRSGCSASSGTA